jgi:hypothetical protein
MARIMKNSPGLKYLIAGLTSGIDQVETYRYERVITGWVGLGRSL